MAASTPKVRASRVEESRGGEDGGGTGWRGWRLGGSYSARRWKAGETRFLDVQ